jgi:hypothetical protein
MWRPSHARDDLKQHLDPFKTPRRTSAVSVRERARFRQKRKDERSTVRLDRRNKVVHARKKFVTLQTKRHIVHMMLCATDGLGSNVVDIITSYWMTPVMAWGERLVRRDDNQTMSEETGSETEWGRSIHNASKTCYTDPDSGKLLHGPHRLDSEGFPYVLLLHKREGPLWLDSAGFPQPASLRTTHPISAPIGYISTTCCCPPCTEVIHIPDNLYPDAFSDRRALSCMLCRGLCWTCMDGPDVSRSCVKCYDHGVGKCEEYLQVRPFRCGSLDIGLNLTVPPVKFRCRDETRNGDPTAERLLRVQKSLEVRKTEVRRMKRREVDWLVASKSNKNGPYGLKPCDDEVEEKNKTKPGKKKRRKWSSEDVFWSSVDDGSVEEEGTQSTRSCFGEQIYSLFVPNTEHRRPPLYGGPLNSRVDTGQASFGGPRNSRVDTEEEIFGGPCNSCVDTEQASLDTALFGSQNAVWETLRQDDPSATEDFMGYYDRGDTGEENCEHTEEFGNESSD